MTGMQEWLVKVLPSGKANSYWSESDAWDAVKVVSSTGHACEIWHHTGAGWESERIEPCDGVAS